MRARHLQQAIVLKGFFCNPFLVCPYFIKRAVSLLCLTLIASLLLFNPVLAGEEDDSPTGSGFTPPANQGSADGRCIDRKKFQDEVNGNTPLIDEICRLAKAEVGINGDCTQQWIETVMNRAHCNNKTVAQTIARCCGSKCYWPCGQKRPGLSGGEQATCKGYVEDVLRGSNQNNYSTDNASNQPGNMVARNRITGGRKGHWCKRGTPRFAANRGNASLMGPELFYTDNHYVSCMNKLKTGSPAGCTPFTLQGGSDGPTQDSNQDPPSKPPQKPPSELPPPGPDGKPGDCDKGCPSCRQCDDDINLHHRTIRAHTTAEFEAHRNWITTTFFLEYMRPAMQMMTSQFSANMMQQVQIIGTFFDAKHQLETQRLFQQMTAEAHRDYQPSEGMCAIGTNTKSLAASERRSNLAQAVFANRLSQRQLSTGDNISRSGEESDRKSRVEDFIKKFCIKTDYAEALNLLCKGGNSKKHMRNMDVDFTSAVENRLTLDLDFTDKGNNSDPTDDEEEIFALGNNLFGNVVLPTMKNLLISNRRGDPYPAAYWYLDLRSVAAKRSVAQNSFAAVTGMKAEGDEEVAPFLKAVLAEAGINPNEIEPRLGEKPSYFAQMEVLTKDLYQNPNFYANLYDKPVNIERKAAALQAIELMQDRDIYKSLLRSEAVLATLVETLILQEHDRLNAELNKAGTATTSIYTGGGGGEEGGEVE